MVWVVTGAHTHSQSALMLVSSMSAGGRMSLFGSAQHIFIFATPYGPLTDLYYCLLSSLVLLMTAQKINILCDFVRHRVQICCC